jgi:hypothetical protein
MSTVQVPQGVCMYGGGGMLHTCPKSLGSRTRPFKIFFLPVFSRLISRSWGLPCLVKSQRLLLPGSSSPLA